MPMRERSKPAARSSATISGRPWKMRMSVVQSWTERGRRPPDHRHRIGARCAQALARDLGAHATIVADRENVVQRVMELTGNRGVDVVVDLTPVATQPIVDAVDAVRVGGTIVLAGIKGGSATVPLDSDRVVVKELTVQGVFTQTGPAYDQAISLLARDSAKFTRLHTHEFPLERAADAIETLAGERTGENAICVSLSPQAR